MIKINDGAQHSQVRSRGNTSSPRYGEYKLLSASYTLLYYIVKHVYQSTDYAARYTSSKITWIEGRIGGLPPLPKKFVWFRRDGVSPPSVSFPNFYRWIPVLFRSYPITMAHKRLPVTHHGECRHSPSNPERRCSGWTWKSAIASLRSHPRTIIL